LVFYDHFNPKNGERGKGRATRVFGLSIILRWEKKKLKLKREKKEGVKRESVPTAVFNKVEGGEREKESWIRLTFDLRSPRGKKKGGFKKKGGRVCTLTAVIVITAEGEEEKSPRMPTKRSIVSMEKGNITEGERREAPTS